MKLSIPFILQNPIPFLLQYNSLSEIQNFKDEHGLTSAHYAIALTDLNKIKEMIYLNFDFSILSSNASIPLIVYLEKPNKKNENFDSFKQSNISFSNSSYTPIHLMFFLYSIYSNFSKSGDFYYASISSKLKEIINLFLDEKTSIDKFVDSNNFSVCDYAFILENPDLIEFCYKKDSSFNISKLNPETCIKILEILKIKDSSVNYQQIEKFSNNLEKKKMFLDLNTELIKKDSNKKITKI